MMKMFAAAAVAAFALGGAAQAQTGSVRFDLVNDTGMNLVFLYISVPTTDEWEEDILGDQVVEPGGTAAVTIDDGLPDCEYDLKAVFDGGAELILGSWDFCELDGGTITVSE